MVHTRLLADRTSGERSTAPGHSGTGTPTRHLAAILAADVAGYSRLMGIDEEGTLERLKAHRHQLLDAKIQEHHGRIVKTTGDGRGGTMEFIVEFLIFMRRRRKYWLYPIVFLALLLGFITVLVEGTAI